jgi:cation transport ATPase
MRADRTPRLVSVVAIGGREETALLAIAASLASGSEYPLGAAIIDSAHERDIELEQAGRQQDIGGNGVAGMVAGHAAVLGNSELFADLGINTGQLGDWAERLQQQGQRVMFLAVDGQTAGLLGVADSTC